VFVIFAILILEHKPLTVNLKGKSELTSWEVSWRKGKVGKSSSLFLSFGAVEVVELRNSFISSHLLSLKG